MSGQAPESDAFPCEAWKHEGERPCPSCASVGYCQAAPTIPPEVTDAEAWVIAPLAFRDEPITPPGQPDGGAA